MKTTSIFSVIAAVIATASTQGVNADLLRRQASSYNCIPFGSMWENTDTMSFHESESDCLANLPCFKGNPSSTSWTAFTSSGRQSYDTKEVCMKDYCKAPQDSDAEVCFNYMVGDLVDSKIGALDERITALENKLGSLKSAIGTGLEKFQEDVSNSF